VEDSGAESGKERFEGEAAAPDKPIVAPSIASFLLKRGWQQSNKGFEPPIITQGGPPTATAVSRPSTSSTTQRSGPKAVATPSEASDPSRPFHYITPNVPIPPPQNPLPPLDSKPVKSDAADIADVYRARLAALTARVTSNFQTNLQQSMDAVAPLGSGAGAWPSDLGKAPNPSESLSAPLVLPQPSYFTSAKAPGGPGLPPSSATFLPRASAAGNGFLMNAGRTSEITLPPPSKPQTASSANKPSSFLGTSTAPATAAPKGGETEPNKFGLGNSGTYKGALPALDNGRGSKIKWVEGET
jgi:hypothetical protein